MRLREHVITGDVTVALTFPEPKVVVGRGQCLETTPWCFLKAVRKLAVPGFCVLAVGLDTFLG